MQNSFSVCTLINHIIVLVSVQHVVKHYRTRWGIYHLQDILMGTRHIHTVYGGSPSHQGRR